MLQSHIEVLRRVYSGRGGGGVWIIGVSHSGEEGGYILEGGGVYSDSVAYLRGRVRQILGERDHRMDSGSVAKL